jgi:hypothetical protein
LRICQYIFAVFMVVLGVGTDSGLEAATRTRTCTCTHGFTGLYGLQIKGDPGTRHAPAGSQVQPRTLLSGYYDL